MTNGHFTNCLLRREKETGEGKKSNQRLKTLFSSEKKSQGQSRKPFCQKRSILSILIFMMGHQSFSMKRRLGGFFGVQAPYFFFKVRRSRGPASHSDEGSDLNWFLSHPHPPELENLFGMMCWLFTAEYFVQDYLSTSDPMLRSNIN